MRPVRIVLIATAVAALLQTPAKAEPSWPVCLHVYGPITYDDCRFASIEQCQPSASGIAAQCITNPWYQAPAAPARRHRTR
jgi:hypothetical protein